MAEQNPIKYSDLISPDDSIEKLIGQLEKVTEAYNGLAASVKSQAASISSSLKTISGATEQGRASTRSASQEVDRLAKAYKDLEFAQSDTAKRIADLKQIQKEQNMMNKLTAESNRAVEGSYNALSAQYRLNMMYINNLTKAERENDPAAKKLIEETKAIYEEMNKMQQATGKFALNVGNYTQSIEQAIGVNSKWYQGLQQLAGLFQGGFKSGVTQAGSAVAGFGKQLLALLANPIVATIAAITAAFMALAKGISTSEENTNTLMRILAPFQRVLTGVVDVLQTMAGWVLKAVEGFESLAMGASRLMERLPLVGSAFKKVNDELQKNVNLERERQQLTRDGRNLTKQEAKTQYEIAVLRRKANQTDDPKLRAAYLQKAVAKERQISQNRVAFLQRELKVMKEKAAQSQNDAATNDAIAQKEAEIWNAMAQAEQRSLRMIRQISTAQNQMNRPTGGGGGKVSNAADQARREAAEQERIRKDAEKKELAAIRQSEDAKVALMDNEYDRERAAVTLSYDRQIEDIRTRLATEKNLTVAAKEALNETIIDLEQQKWNKLADISDKEMNAALDAEQRDYEARIKATDNLIREQQENRKKNPDMYDLLGFNLSDEKKEAINTSLQFAMDSLNQYMEAYVAAAEKKAELAGQEVDRAQRTLQMEMEARNAGYANNVEQARKELALARQTEQKALEDQKRAQKQQAAIQALQQVESLITASAKIWGQLGFPWAIPAIAVMFASFAASKVMAANAVGAGTEKYGEGTVELLEGGSHQSGNDIDLGRKKDGTRRRAEGGEYFAVINKRNSRKYGDIIPDVINSLNNGTFAEKYMKSYDGGGVVVNMGGRPDLRELTDSVNDIREQGRRRSYTDGRGNEIEIYKNLKRTTYNAN